MDATAGEKISLSLAPKNEFTGDAARSFNERKE